MAETLTVRVEGAASVNVDVRGVTLFTDAGLTTPATFPADITADTSWYAAEPAAGARHFTVTVTLPDGTVTMPNISFQSLPLTIDALEGRASGVDGTATGGGSVPSITYMALSGASIGDAGSLIWANVDESAGSLLTLDSDTGKLTVTAEALVSMAIWITITTGDASDWSIGLTDNDSPTFGPESQEAASGKNSAHSATYRFDAGDVFWPFINPTSGPSLTPSQGFLYVTATPVTSADPNL